MNEKRNSNKAGHKPVSIDGFVSGGAQLGLRRHQAYQPTKGRPTPTLDSFIRRTDGFYPQRSSPGGIGGTAESLETEALLNEPIVLDDDHKKQRQHYFKHKHPKIRKVLKRTSLAFAMLLLVGGAYFAIQLYMAKNNLFLGGGKSPALSKCAELSELKKEGDCRVNVLLLGIGGQGHAGGDLTDTIMVASIDPINKKTSLLSIPRDLWVKIPRDGNNRINEAFAYGKSNSDAKDDKGKQREAVELVDETLEPILGIPIHYHVVTDFSAFEQIVDALGGIDINVPEELTVYERLWIEGTSRHYLLNVKEGQQHFDGTKALYYARSRQTSKRGDFDRSERQKLLLTGIKDKILSVGTFSNPVKISQLLSSLGNNVYTDFELEDMRRIYEAMENIPSNNITSIDLVTPPHDFLTTGNINGKSIVRPKAGLFDYTAIQAYVRNAFKDAQIARENSSIAVYNATSTEGLAAKKADELKSFGYNITTVDNAKVTDSSTTIIVDLTKGSHKYTKHYLETRFGVSVRGSLPSESAITPPEGTNFVIILGKDAAATR